MCGINFILDKKGVLDGKSVHQMNSATRHRGPDNSGIHSLNQDGKNIFFAASRLKIMDLSDHANQPMITKDGNYVLVFNGEIYNFHEIKNSILAKGYKFKSSSDTEVLFYALIEFGETIVETLNGMFAFVFYDKIHNYTLAARDKAGMKPLFYYENDNFLIISSEIKGILASGLVKKTLDEQQIPHYLKFRFAKKPNTFFKNIFELEEGKTLSKNGDEKVMVKDFNVFSNQECIEIQDIHLVEKIEELLYDAFLRHTLSDARLGLFLSGGIDSTLLLSLAHREIIPMPTFSVVLEKSARSFSTEDGHYSRLAVRKFGNSIDHHEIPVSIGILDELDEMIGQMDQPVGDSATLTTWYLSRFANNMVKTVLSGAGADELFAGYNRHQAYHHYLRHYKKFKKPMGILKSIGKLLPTGFDHPYRKKARLVKKFLMDLDKNPAQTYQNFVSMGFPLTHETLIESENKDSHQLFGNALQQDLHGYLISDVLTVNDRMAMAHGLEMRMPYLDGVLFDFIQSIDPVQLIDNGQKWILKTILSRMGGIEFCKRPKEGFGLPFGHWIRRNEFGMRAVFNEKQEIINKFVGLDQVRKMYGDHMRLKSDHTTGLWAYLILAKWLKLHGFGGQ